MIFVCKLPINKIKDYLFSILSLSGPSSVSPYRVRQIMALIKTLSKTKCPLFYIFFSLKKNLLNFENEFIDIENHEFNGSKWEERGMRN
jgi:hypothetical protein